LSKTVTTTNKKTNLQIDKTPPSTPDDTDIISINGINSDPDQEEVEEEHILSNNELEIITDTSNTVIENTLIPPTNLVSTTSPLPSPPPIVSEEDTVAIEATDNIIATDNNNNHHVLQKMSAP